MNVRLNSNHPDYTNLAAYYPFNEGSGNTANDNSPNSATANFNGNVGWQYSRGENINQFFSPTSFRPTIKMFQGDYITTTTTTIVLDSILATPNTVQEQNIYSNFNSLNHDSYCNSIIKYILARY